MILKIKNIENGEYEELKINNILNIIPKESKQYMVCNYDSHGLFRSYKLEANAGSFDFSEYDEFIPDTRLSDDREYFTETEYGKIKYLNCIEAEKNIFKDTIILTVLFESDEVFLDDEPIDLDGSS